MEEMYHVNYQGKTVGTVVLQIQGLYYLLECRCMLPEMRRVSLFANEIDLGILVPEDGVLGLSKKVPRKKLSGDSISFYLKERDNLENSIFIPICDKMPVSSIERLGEAKFVRTENATMLKLPIH